MRITRAFTIKCSCSGVLFVSAFNLGKKYCKQNQFVWFEYAVYTDGIRNNINCSMGNAKPLWQVILILISVAYRIICNFSYTDSDTWTTDDVACGWITGVMSTCVGVTGVTVDWTVWRIVIGVTVQLVLYRQTTATRKHSQ